jgi:molybdate transport system ATP-binding protein
LKVVVKKRISQDFDLDVAFEAPDGLTIVFGPSGSGKTTLLRLIAGVTKPDEGNISLNNRVFYDSARRISMPVQQRKIGYVFQNSALFPHMTASQNVAYGCTSQISPLELMALFKIEQRGDSYPRDLSGGEAQRVALARALASEPDLMLLDEPLSALDGKTRTLIQDEIRQAQERANIPFLYVTHQVSEALALGTHALLLERGRLQSQGSPSEILSAS